MKETSLEYDEVDARVYAFLADLEAICDKHGVTTVGSCGCCESPWVIVKDADHDYTNLYRKKTGEFTAKRDDVPMVDESIPKSRSRIIGWKRGFYITKDGKVG